MQHILQSYLRRLTNLSANNRSLVLLRLLSDQFIDLHDFDFMDMSPSFRIIEDLIAQKSKIPLIPNSDSRDAKSNQLATRLRKVKRREQFLFEETGGKDLYIGWPFVHGKFNDGTIVRAPLVFFPVSLEIEDNAWTLRPRKDVNITFNKSFLMAYAHFNKVNLDEDLLERSLDDLDKGSTVFRTSLYDLLEESKIAIRFGSAIYADKLKSFTETNKQEFEKNNNLGSLNLASEAVLGIFPQADSYLMPDYEFMLERSQAADLDEFFANKNLSEQNAFGPDFDAYRYFLNKVKEEETFTPFRKDVHQENAIKAVKKGNSLVIQGPPGTGKSQLICNLMADYMARGKKVLLVSQKRAALDVVYERLKTKEITDFVALVHDFKNDRKDIYSKIANQIERLNEYKRNNTNLDAIQLDRSFKQASRSIDDITEALEEYKAALFDDAESGLSIKELYLTSDPEKESIPLVQEYNEIDFRGNQFELEMTRYFEYAQKLNQENYPWAERVDFSRFKIQDFSKILEYLDEIPKETRHLATEVSKILATTVDYDTCRRMGENLTKLKEFNEHLKNETVYALLKPMIGLPNREADLLWLANNRRLINKCFEGEGVEPSISNQEISEMQRLLKKRQSAKKSLVQSLKWRFSKEKMKVARALVANGLSNSNEDFKRLDQKIDNRLNLQHQITKIKSVTWVEMVPVSLDQQALNDWIDHLEQALKAKLIFTSFSNFKEYFPVNKLSAKEIKQRISEVRKVLMGLPKKREDWNSYILPSQIDRLLLSPDFHTQLKRTLKRDFDSICEMDQIKDSLSSARLAGLKRLEELGEKSTKEYIAIFDNSLRLAWIDHIELKYPVLRTVSTLKFEQMVSELQDAEKVKLDTSTQILLQKVREKTYEPAEYNRLNNMITYRDLEHQVNKKRQIWPLRKLINHFSEDIFSLIPCWMASPESVSAVFPMESFFDLVIFDEASQCFAEKGLPAMYRGKQLVVAGDSQQLQPNDLYRVKWEEDTEEMALEVESLLALSSKYLMQVQLQGHYRSQSNALIEFSNQHFYKGKLQTIPHFEHINDNTPAIDFIKLDGIWSKQTNELEANHVVEVLKKLRKSQPEKSVGVVTFNIAQRHLIEDKVEAEGLNDIAGIFVKNIENVQGDERDIIVFSTAYGKDEKGKINLQFGSLNAVGGENRLNVAITRAKEKIIIITSLMPQEMAVDKVKNEGPKLLKAYLIYAQQVSDGSYEPVALQDSSFGQSWYLKNRLKHWEKDFSMKFTEELPLADLSLKWRGKYKGLLFTDDNVFYTSSTIKDSFVYKPFLLESKGWNYKFVHSRNFWKDPQVVKENIRRLVESVNDND